MGCTNCKAASPPAESIVASQGLLGAGGALFKNTSIMMCPYFKVASAQKEAWKRSCDAFYQSAVESDDVLFYGTAFNDRGAHVRQGFRSAEAIVSHLQRTETHMTKALKTSTLEKVEVHGSRRQIMKVKKQVTKIDQTSLQFFEVHPKMHSICRPTEFSGGYGSDRLVSVHVTVQVRTATELRAMESKVKCLHRRACGSSSTESFFFSRCMEHGVAKIVAAFESMEAGMEHIACMVSHLGQEDLHSLEMHGPESELAKVQALMGKAVADTAEAARLCKAALKAAAKNAAEDALQAEACAAAAATASGQRARGALEHARNKACEGLRALHERAKSQEEQVYREALKVEGATEAAAKAAAEAAYKRAMDAIGDMRQAADNAAKAAYDEAMAAGRGMAYALDKADASAQAAAKAAHDELRELAGDAQVAVGKAKAAGDAGVKALEEESVAIRFSVEVGVVDVKRMSSEASREARWAILKFCSSVEHDTAVACEATYKRAREAGEVTVKAFGTARDKAVSAAGTVAMTSEHVYLMAYDRALQGGKTAAQAKDTALQALDYADSKAVDLWKQGAELAAGAAKTAESMTKEGARALAEAMSGGCVWVLDAASTIRRSLVRGAHGSADLVREGMVDFAWAVGTVVEAASDAFETTAGVIGDAGSSLKHHVDTAITMIPHFAVAQEHRDRFQKVCDGFHRISKSTTDTLFYGACYTEGGACIRHGYRSASAMLSYLKESEGVMAQAMKVSTLKRVEVHGTRRQLARVRRQVTKVGSVRIDFYESRGEVRSIRRAAHFSGGPDAMVTTHVAVNVAEETQQVVHQQIKHVHRAARDHPDVHSFSMTRCAKTGAVKLMGTFASMEAGMEHLCVTAMHLGGTGLHSLEMHGPGMELDKVRGFLGQAAAAAAGTMTSCDSTVKGALAAALKRAEEEVLEAKAVAEAAEQAAMHAASDAAKGARERMASTMNGLQKEAEAMAQTAYQEAMQADEAAVQAEAAAEGRAKDLAKRAYRSAMNAASAIRQSADEKARTAYERAMDAGASAEKALSDAQRAADDAANAMREELIETAKAAQNEFVAADESVKTRLQVDATIAKVAASFAVRAAEAVVSDAAKGARAAMLGLFTSLKATSEKAVMTHYRTEVYSEERICVVTDRARSAAWSIAVSHEEAYFATYEKLVIKRRPVAEALEAGVRVGEEAVGKAVGVWRQGEGLAAGALQAAKEMATEGKGALAGLLASGKAFVLDSQQSVRNSLYSGAVLAEGEVHEGTEDVALAVSAVLLDLSEGTDSAHDTLSNEIKSRYSSFAAAEARGPRAVAGSADASADRAEHRQRVCC